MLKVGLIGCGFMGAMHATSCIVKVSSNSLN